MNPTIIITMAGAATLAACRVVLRRGSLELAKSAGQAVPRFTWDCIKAVIGITDSDLEETQYELPDVYHHAKAIEEAFAAAGFKVRINVELDPTIKISPKPDAKEQGDQTKPNPVEVTQ